MDLVEVGWGDVDGIGLAQDRDRWRALVNSVSNLLILVCVCLPACLSLLSVQQKINKKKNTTEKHKWKRAKYNHVQEKATKTAKQIPSGI
jgi:hypothetical protein